MKRLILFLLLALPVMASAQTGSSTSTPGSPTSSTTTTTPNQLPMWRCKLPGGSYEVLLKAIVSVSSHEYLVDGIARVTEVNVDTQSSTLVRFYYLEPNAPKGPAGVGDDLIEKGKELLTEGAEKSGQDAWKKVIKNYPTTTHARTIEYRLVAKEQLQALFSSVETAWRTQKGADFSAQ